MELTKTSRKRTNKKRTSKRKTEAGQLTYLFQNFVPYLTASASGISTFIDKHFFTLIFCGILFYTVVTFRGVDTSNWLKFDWNVNPVINASLFQKVIPQKEDKEGFRERVRKLFDRDYVNADQFESDYKMTTADYQWKYPALRDKRIRSKDELAAFIEGR